jgi:hypothetical protein
MGVVRAIFGGHGQVVVGVLMLVAALVQWALAILHLHDQAYLVRLLVHVSMEALVFGGYGVIATGLRLRATERVETAVAQSNDPTTR